MSHEVVYLPVGSRSGNLALSALAVRTVQDGAELLAQVAGYGSLDQEALLTIETDGRLFDSIVTFCALFFLVAAEDQSLALWAPVAISLFIIDKLIFIKRSGWFLRGLFLGR